MMRTILIFLLLLVVQQTAGTTFSKKLQKMLRGRNRHLEEASKWRPDRETALRVKRAATPTVDSEDVSYFDDNEYFYPPPMENCPEGSKYAIEDIYEQSFTGPVCNIIDVRNSPERMKDLENCTIVNGFVHLVFMRNMKEEDFLKYRFPKLRVITQYLLVYRLFNLKTLRNMFPNLAVIGGRVTLRGYSLVLYENPNLIEVGLENLQFINRGGVRIEKNAMLCYLTTIDWKRIGRYENKDIVNNVILSGNKDYDKCVDQCGINSGCDNGEQGGEFCWGLRICQKKLCPSACPYACDDDYQCTCHEQCLAGCTRSNDATACKGCKDKYFNNTCVSQCPPGKYLIDDWHCIEMEECQKLDWHFFESTCVSGCPAGYQVNISDCKRMCVKCEGECGQECRGDFLVEDLETLHNVEGCRTIEGTLMITINRGSDVLEKLDDAFKDLEVVGSLIVRRSFSLVSLSFLRNLKRITGKHKEQDMYSVYVLENQNLEELWNLTENRLVIEDGKAFFHFNPKLCRTEVKKMEKLTPLIEDLTDVSDTTNGDKATCDFSTIKIVEVLIDDNPNVIIRWENFVVKDQRTLIGYQIYYKESPEKNAKKYDGIDACRRNDWYLVETPKPKYTMPAFNFNFTDKEFNLTDIVTGNETEPVGISYKLVTKLKPYTQYAYYVKAFTTSNAEKGASSDIQYFMTNPAAPSTPQNLRSISTNTTSINITWDPPENPNGNITHYIVEWQKQLEEDLQNVRSVDSCKLTRTRMNPSYDRTQTSKPPKQTSEKKTTEKQIRCEDEQRRLADSDEDARESRKFENFLQDHIFFNLEDMAYAAEQASYDYYIDMSDVVDFNDSVEENRRKRSIMRRSSGVRNDSATSHDTTTVASTLDYLETTTPVSLEHPKFRLVVTGNGATLNGLEHFSEYSIQVYACNHASDPQSRTNLSFPIKAFSGRKSNYTRCSIEAMMMKRTSPNKTADKIPEDGIKVEGTENGMSEGKVKLVWKMPPDPNAYIKNFKIEVLRSDGEKSDHSFDFCVHVNSSADRSGYVSTFIADRNDLPTGTYNAKVLPVSLAGSGVWSGSVEFSVVHTSDAETAKSYALIFGLIALALVAIFAVMLVLFVRYRQKPEDHTGAYTDMNPDYMSYVYIPDEYEVDIENVTLLDEIGHGNFGKVFGGIVKDIVKGQSETKVAVKTLHENANPARRYEFLKEASLMKSFNAYHVVRLLGVVSKNADPMVIMEFMEIGDLKNYLRTRREDDEGNQSCGTPLTLREKLQMAAEIADGMAYLSAYKFVHRDLAARNCLVNAHGTVKIGDFGLARDIYETDYYRKESRGFLPIRWMAPESLKDGVFDSRSDVWSYGVVLWELATLAQQPYQGKQHDEVTKWVIDGGYMEKPKNCPKRLYDLMIACWEYNPTMRPEFLEIVQGLLVDVNDEFKEVCFYGKSEQLRLAEDEGQVYTGQNHSDMNDSAYPYSDLTMSPLTPQTDGSSVLTHRPNDNFYIIYKNSKKSGRRPSNLSRTDVEESQGLLSNQTVLGNEEIPLQGDARSLNTTSTTAPRTPQSVGTKQIRQRYSNESIYENGSNDVRELLQNERNSNAGDSGTYMNQTPQINEKDPLIHYKHMNGNHKKSRDLELDVESGLDEGVWGHSSSPSIASTDQQNDDMMGIQSESSSC